MYLRLLKQLNDWTEKRWRKEKTQQDNKERSIWWVCKLLLAILQPIYNVWSVWVDHFLALANQAASRQTTHFWLAGYLGGVRQRHGGDSWYQPLWDSSRLFRNLLVTSRWLCPLFYTVSTQLSSDYCCTFRKSHMGKVCFWKLYTYFLCKIQWLFHCYCKGSLGREVSLILWQQNAKFNIQGQERPVGFNFSF